MSADGSSSSREEQKSLQAYGQAQYRFENYEEALDAFNKVRDKISLAEYFKRLID